jgi:hypothetical protein
MIVGRMLEGPSTMPANMINSGDYPYEGQFQQTFKPDYLKSSKPKIGDNDSGCGISD